MKLRRKKKYIKYIETKREKLKRVARAIRTTAPKVPSALRKTAKGLQKVGQQYQREAAKIGKWGDRIMTSISAPAPESRDLLSEIMGERKQRPTRPPPPQPVRETRRPEWTVVKDKKSLKVLKGVYVKAYPSRALVKATPELVVVGNILRDAVGGAVLFDENGNIVGHASVDYESGGNAYATWWGGALIGYRRR